MGPAGRAIALPRDLAAEAKPEECTAFERERWFRYRETFELQRLIVDQCRMSRSCPREACSRAGQCVTEDAACRAERRQYLADHVYPHVRWAMRRAKMGYAEEQSQGRRK